MVAVTSFQTFPDAAVTPYTTGDEAHALLCTELDRFIALVETLGTDDLGRPTACTAWNVGDILAHQAGGYASGLGYRQMFRQYAVIPRGGQLIEDAINQRQLQQRAGRSPAELIAELRRSGPIAARKWAYQFRLIKPVFAPHPVGGRLSVRHLMWIIHSRDTWMHRLDICRATNRAFYQTAGHDGRIVALVMRDVAAVLRDQLGGQAVIFELTGVAGGVWKIGPGQAAATITMDALDFNIFASGRFTTNEGLAKAAIRGDAALAELALQKTVVLY